MFMSNKYQIWFLIYFLLFTNLNICCTLFQANFTWINIMKRGKLIFTSKTIEWLQTASFFKTSEFEWRKTLSDDSTEELGITWEDSDETNLFSEFSFLLRDDMRLLFLRKSESWKILRVFSVALNTSSSVDDILIWTWIQRR